MQVFLGLNNQALKKKCHLFCAYSHASALSAEAAYEKEEDWKFRYVYKGPQNARQKKVYYVYGIGWDPQNKTLKRRLDDVPSGPPVLRIPNHVYYNIVFLSQGRKYTSNYEIVGFTKDLAKKTQFLLL